MTNKYGKSAIEATRRNMLPLYLDETIDELKTNIDLTKSLILELSNWVEEKDSEGNIVAYKQTIPFDLEGKDGILTIFPDGQNSIDYARAQVNCSFDKEQAVLVFTAINKPLKNLRVLAFITGMIIKSLPIAEQVEF